MYKLIINTTLLSMTIATSGLISGCNIAFDNGKFSYNNTDDASALTPRFDIENYTALENADASLEGLWVMTAINVQTEYNLLRQTVAFDIGDPLGDTNNYRVSEVVLTGQGHVRQLCNFILADDETTQTSIEYTSDCSFQQNGGFIYTPADNSFTAVDNTLILAVSENKAMQGNMGIGTDNVSAIQMRRIADVGLNLGDFSLTLADGETSSTEQVSSISAFTESEVSYSFNIASLNFKQTFSINHLSLRADNGQLSLSSHIGVHHQLSDTMTVDDTSVPVYSELELMAANSIVINTQNLSATDYKVVYEGKVIDKETDVEHVNMLEDYSLIYTIDNNSSSGYSLSFSGIDKETGKLMSGQALLSF
ncbi:MAG: hypothetical protein HRU20_10545 [Pseudomonadales bacterium]|nr:hypothetical protein [Pseudomonadales bacterium]